MKKIIMTTKTNSCGCCAGCRKNRLGWSCCCYLGRRSVFVVGWYRVKGQAGATTGTIREPCDNVKPEPKKNKKHKKQASLMCLLVETSWSPSTHIGKPLTVDLLLYMSTTSTTTSATSFPHALTVWNGSKWIKTAICIAVFVNLNQWW